MITPRKSAMGALRAERAHFRGLCQREVTRHLVAHPEEEQ